MSGSEVAREIKRLRSDCPVVLLTGASPGFDPRAEEASASSSFNLVLQKPITSQKLATAISLSMN